MRELLCLVTLWSVVLATAGGNVVRAAVAAVPARMSVLGTVLDRRSAWEGGTIVTRTRLRIDRVMQGNAPMASVVEVTELGGRVGDLAQVVPGQPKMPDRTNVAVELTPVATTWRMTAVLEQVASPDSKLPTEPLQVGAVAYVRTTTKDSEPPCEGEQKDVYWPVATVHYALDSACSQDVDLDACEAAVARSFQTWQDVDCSYMSFTYDGRMADAPFGFHRDGPNVNVVKWQEEEWPGDPAAQAITLVTLGCGSGRVLDADILVNGVVGTFSTEDLQEQGTVDVQNTITHEAGHLLGFAHSSDPESTMFATAVLNETKKRDLTADDSQGLCDTYPLGHEPGADQGCACAMARESTTDWRTGVTVWGAVMILVLRAGRVRARQKRPPG